MLYKVLLNLPIFPVLNIYCTEPYLGPVQRSYVYLYWQSHGSLIPIIIIVQFFEHKIPEKVLLNGAISICRRFTKVSHRFEAKMCGLSLLASFTFWVFTLWHMRLVLYSKWKSSITALPPLTTISPSKRDSMLLRAFLLSLKFEHQSFVLNRRFFKFIFNFLKISWDTIEQHTYTSSLPTFLLGRRRNHTQENYKNFLCPRGESKLMTSKF